MYIEDLIIYAIIKMQVMQNSFDLNKSRRNLR